MPEYVPALTSVVVASLLLFGSMKLLNKRILEAKFETSVARFNWVAIAAMGLSIGSFFIGGHWAISILAGLNITLSALWLVLRLLAPQSSQAPAFTIGEQFPSFVGVDDNNEVFDLTALDGKPVLLKFFRGHW